MPKILITTSSFDLDNNTILKALLNEGYEIVLNPYGRRLRSEEVLGLMDDDVVGMIAGVEPLTREVLEQAANLKVISRCGIGTNNVDLEAARALGIVVNNTPDAPTQAAAELTIGLMLDLLRKISQADKNIRNDKWKPLMGNLLSGKTVGIIGYGRIGRRVSEILPGFGAKPIFFDPHVTKGVGGFERASSMAELLSSADIVSLHVPYSTETHYLINSNTLSLMKRGSYLLNVSRGGLINESDLLAALESGLLAGAALDTFEDEPYLGPLRELPQVVMTAHMGSYARESRVQMEAEAANNLVKGLTTSLRVTLTEDRD